MKITMKAKLIYDQGHGGVIYKFYDRHKNPYIIKKPHSSKLYLHKNEISILQQLQHPNIIEFIKTTYTNYLITPFANGGDLFNWIHPTYGVFLNSENVRAIIKPIINALIYTNTKGISHRDIKLENIVIHNGTPKLIDWGFAYQRKFTEELCEKRLGTDGYMSPQIILRKKYSPEKNDVWSLGVVIFLLLVQVFPYNESSIHNINEYLQSIIDNNWTGFWNSHVKYNSKAKILYDSDFRNLIQNMLNPDQTKRYDLQEVLNHKWFQQKFSTQLEIQKLQEIVTKRKTIFTSIIKIQSICRGFLVRKKRFRLFSK